MTKRMDCRVGAACVLALMAPVACAPEAEVAARDTGGAPGSGGAATGGGTAGSGTGGTPSTGGALAGTGGAPRVTPCDGLPIAEPPLGGGAGGAGTCTGVAFEVEHLPLDLLLLMDRTFSQSYLVAGTQTSRWEAMLEAVRQFSTAIADQDVRAGIVFQNAHGSGDADRECVVSDYATPVVPIQPIAEAGPLIVEAMENLSPSGLTPLVPAVTGAMQYAREWALENPGRHTVLVLVGDGFPTLCDPVSPSDVNAVLAEGWAAEPPVRTFAVGVGASSELNLDGYARAGGTSDALMTDDSGVTEDFLAALLNITDSAVPCTLEVPSAPSTLEMVSFAHVSVVYDPFIGEPMEIPAAGTPANCDAGGWYYDNAVAPTQVLMCPCSCARLGAGLIEARFDCLPRTIIR